MVSEKSKKMSVYEYFNYCKRRKGTRGVAVITDKQYVFYSQVEENDYTTHDGIFIKIEGELHSNGATANWNDIRQNDMFVASLGKELIIFLPSNKELSMSQYSFLCDILDQVIKFNSEQEKEDQIEIYVWGAKNISEEKHTDIEKLKKDLYANVTKSIVINEEKIIGKTLDRETIINNIKYHIDIESVKNLSDLKAFLIRCMNYYSDSFYKEIFKSMFKDFEQVREIMSIFYLCGIDLKIQNATLDNILSLLFQNLNSVFCHSSLNQIKTFFDYLSKLNISKEIIENYYLNFFEIAKYINEISIKDEQQKENYDIIFKNAENYEDVVSLVIRITYYQKIEEISKIEREIEYYKNSLKDVKYKNNIIEDKERIIELIDRYKKLNILLAECEETISRNNDLIEEENNNIEIQNASINDLSKNKLRKLLNRKKVNISMLSIEASKTRIADITLQNEKAQMSKEQILEEINQIENLFKEKYGLSKIPTDELFIDMLINNKDLTEEEIVIKIKLLERKLSQEKTIKEDLKDKYKISEEEIFDEDASIKK